MALFQKSVLKKHILDQNTAVVDAAYQRFTAYFHNATIQQNIRNAKEEQFQEGFLRELFGVVLNYTLNPQPNFNLTTELKNTTNSKKADGAILVNDKVMAVIELKGTDTTDLNKIEAQAFGYKNNQAECNYVITSNFEKLRFYIDNTIDYEEFNLFALTRDQFSLLYLCLSYDNLKNNVPKRLKAESVSQEDQISKKLYKDYSEFKRALYNNLVELNPKFDKLLLFKKMQKLLDRFLFIFFAEDTNLLPTNLIFRINKEWKNLQEMRIPVSLYERYLLYFNDLNHGAKVTLPAFGNKTGEAITAEFEIFAYNGGLFQTDEVLDNVKIDDKVLHTYSEKLSHYDFDSDVDVNILGHIFENSLNEIDEIKSEIEGTAVDKTKTKRKKDGVFYTPKYITKYIVDNAVGKLCAEKKAELKLADEDYTNDKKLQTKTKKALLDKLAEYRAWLLQLTICDPACGSGAFLNQALEFLIAEHRYVDELQAKLMGDSMILSDVETSILENNIYGVDLNDESVEIAKLSLWLRTAQKGRKLNSLNNNIKCGNSLIDDPEVAGDKAFSWEKEFPEVFARGGFDVVIGNPPYGANFDSLTKEYLKIKFSEIHVRTPESYNYFIGQIIKITKEKEGISSIIIPSSILNQIEFEKTRSKLLNECSLNQIVNLGDSIFSDVSTPTCIIGFSKNTLNDIVKYQDLTNIERSLVQTELGNGVFLTTKNTYIENQSFSFIYKTNKSIITKCYKNRLTIKDVVEDVATGISPGLGEAFVIEKRFALDLKIEEEILKKLVIGGEINRYNLTPISNKFIIYFSSKLNVEDYPNCLNHLAKYRLKLENRVETKSGAIPWFVMLRPRRQKLFDNPKILIRQTSDRILAAYDLDKWYCLKSGLIIQLPENSKISYLYFLSILNSSLMHFIYKDLVNEENRIFPEVKPIQIFKLPIAYDKKVNQQPFIDKADLMLSLNKDFQTQTQKLSTYICSQYHLEKLSGKLSAWYELDFSDFIKELNKAIKAVKGTPLSKKDEFEWMELFEENKQKALALKAEIDRTDKEIDQMVYELYGLTEEEIMIVEGEK